MFHFRPALQPLKFQLPALDPLVSVITRGWFDPDAVRLADGLGVGTGPLFWKTVIFQQLWRLCTDIPFRRSYS